VIDVVELDIYKLLPKSKTKLILIYTTLSDLIKNLTKRQATSPISQWTPFNQYADRYIKSNKEDDIINTISRPTFIKILKKSKYF
jgi:hypothetical protein